jgi:hypothetical protein
MEQKKVGLYDVRWIRWVAAPHHALIHQEALHCHGRNSLSTRLCGTNFTQICLLPKYSRGIHVWGIIPWLMCSWSSINFRLIHWSLATIIKTFTTASRCRAVDGRPLLGSSSRPCHLLWILKLGDMGTRNSFISITVLSILYVFSSVFPKYETKLTFSHAVPLCF